MTTTGNSLDFKIPFQLVQTLASGRHSLPDRGMGLSSLVIKIEAKSAEEEITRTSEARARQLLGDKIDKTV